MTPLAQSEVLSLAIAGISGAGLVLAVLLAIAEQHHHQQALLFDVYRALALASGVNLSVSLSIAIDPQLFYDDFLASSLGGMALGIGPGLGITFFLAERRKYARGRHPLQRTAPHA